MYIVCKIWFWCGLFGWMIGTAGDMFFYKKQPVKSPMLIIGGPLTLWIGLSSVGWGIYYAIKKVRKGKTK